MIVYNWYSSEITADGEYFSDLQTAKLATIDRKIIHVSPEDALNNLIKKYGEIKGYEICTEKDSMILYMQKGCVEINWDTRILQLIRSILQYKTEIPLVELKRLYGPL